MNFNDLTQTQMERLGHLFCDKLRDDEGLAPVLHNHHGDVIAALLEGKRVLAGIQIDQNGRVCNWTGVPSPRFVREHDITPASEMLRQHLARTGKDVITFPEHMLSQEAENLLENREDPGKFTIEYENGTGRAALTPEYKERMAPRLPSPPTEVWRPIACNRSCKTCHP